MIYIAQNAARYPEYPLEPLFRSLYIADPSFDFHSVDLVTDRNNLRKLLSFVNPGLSKYDVGSFTINVEVVKDTAIFCRTETETFRIVQPFEFVGYGHEFEKAFTTEQIKGGTGHHRIIKYQFSDLEFVVRYETVGYVGVPAQTITGKGRNDDLSSLLQSLSIGSTPSAASASSKLMVRREGSMVDIDSTLEIKTRVFTKPIEVREVLPQLWVSQTPNLVRAYHRQGVFSPPKVENVTPNIESWEEDHQDDLKALATLIRKIISVTQAQGGKSVIKYDQQSDRLLISPTEGPKLLPDDLYSTFDATQTEAMKQTPSENGSKASRTQVKVGDATYDIDISKIPYFSALVKFKRSAQQKSSCLVHESIPLFDIALKGIESGYRSSFRLLGDNVSQYHALCETYDSLKVDVIGGRSIEQICEGLRAGKTTFELENKRYRPVRGNKSVARDAAFQLLFLITTAEFTNAVKESDKIFNAVLFVVSHPGTFKWRVRTVVRAAYEERFISTSKQKATLDRWNKTKPVDDASDDSETTEVESFSDYYFSD